MTLFQAAAQIMRKNNAHLPLDPSTVDPDDETSGLPYAHRIAQIRFNQVDFQAMLDDVDHQEAAEMNRAIDAEHVDRDEDDDDQVWDLDGSRLASVNALLERSANFSDTIDSISEKRELERVFNAEERMPDPEIEKALEPFESLPPQKEKETEPGNIIRERVRKRQEKIDLFKARKELAKEKKKDKAKAGDFIPHEYSEYYGKFFS